MPDINIIKLKVRRGTNSQRLGVVLEQGELGYTIDTKRLFVGDGATLGGNSTGTVAFAPLNSSGSRVSVTQAVRNDIVNENGLLYQLSGTDYSALSSWAFIGTKVDGTTLEYNAQNQLRVKGVNVYNAGAISNNATSGLSANIDNTTIKINSNQLQVGLITPTNIDASVVGNGLQGGAGQALSVKAGTGFSFSTSTLVLTSLPAGIVDGNALSANAIGAGIVVDANKITTVLQGVDGVTMQNVSGIISIKPIVGAGNSFLKTLTFNDKGQITGSASTITNTFTARNLTAALSVFNGAPDQISEGYLRSTVTQFPVLSANAAGTSTTIQLSSAGFISFETTGSINGSIVDRFAIPIYTY
jgi:hypothetical protein